MSYPPHGYPPPNWQSWQPPSHQHSPLEIERRLTQLEDATEHHQELHQEHRESHGRLKGRLSLHEKAILAICGVLQILLQDKYPEIAKLIRGVLLP